MQGYQMVAELTQGEESMEKGPRVLIVDDDKEVRHSLHYALSSYNMQVTLCDNATEALLAAMMGQFDFIMTGYEMPGMNGVELVQRIRPLQHPLVVIIGMGVMDVHREFLEAGANDFLAKPFVPHHAAMMIDGGDMPA